MQLLSFEEGAEGDFANEGAEGVVLGFEFGKDFFDVVIVGEFHGSSQAGDEDGLCEFVGELVLMEKGGCLML